jgi:hypothetical protein
VLGLVLGYRFWAVCFCVVVIDIELQIVQMNVVLFFGIGEVCQQDQVDLLVLNVYSQEVLQDDENGLIEGFVVAKYLVFFYVNDDFLFWCCCILV